ncbi:MAG: glycosyltransferase [Planctomycetes bacterium]|nr:glycosyltransferase [Planctomycetota bacterium]
MAGEATPRLLHVFATFDVGGPQVRTVTIRERLGDRFEHGFVAADGRQGAARLLRGPPAPVFAVSRPASTRAQLRSLRDLVRRFRPDLVLTYNWGAVLGGVAARLCGVPFVHHEETVPIEERGAGLRRRDWFRRVVLAGARATVCVSTAMHERARRRWRVPAARCLLLPNAVDTDRHAPGPAEPAGPLVVGCVAQARPEKNWGRLLRAFAAAGAEDARLLLVGDGPERASAVRLARALGIAERTTFAGAATDPTMHYRRMHVFALPSDDEQHPLALLEAMGHALPVVATDVGDVRATLPAAQRPLVVPPADEPAFARHLADLLADADLRAQLGAANRRHVVAHHALRDLAVRYAELYTRSIHTPDSLHLAS